jgi:hypothetical protein
VENSVYENKHTLLKKLNCFFPLQNGYSGNECVVEISLYVCSLCMVSVVKCQIDSNIVTICCIPKARVGWKHRMWYMLTEREVLSALEH